MKKEISPILFTEITITELNLMIYLTTFSYKSYYVSVKILIFM